MKKLFAALALALALAACTNVPYTGGCNSATVSIPGCGNGGGDE